MMALSGYDPGIREGWPFPLLKNVQGNFSTSSLEASFFGKACLVKKILGKEKTERIEKKIAISCLRRGVREVEHCSLFMVGVQ